MSQFDEHTRAVLALRTRGYAETLLRSATPEEVQLLAACVDEAGAPASDIAQRISDWLEEYYAARKAAVDKE